MRHSVGTLKAIRDTDYEVYAAIRSEEKRQRENLVLIASENYASPAVLGAQGSLMTNKYAEGYPGKRYYGGCQYVDVVEELAIARAKERNCHVVQLTTDKTRPAAKAFYETLGFQATHEGMKLHLKIDAHIGK